MHVFDCILRSFSNGLGLTSEAPFANKIRISLTRQERLSSGQADIGLSTFWASMT